jgi:D-alanyl-D-alanine carboxypeptidase/D-alanyl-D-alanine endopeptidase (penicillin-binding protein 7)
MRAKPFGITLREGVERALKKVVLPLLITYFATSAAAVPIRSAHALVIDEGTDQVLLEKNSTASVPIASLTKLMTAMVVLDAKQSSDEVIRIQRADFAALKHTYAGVPAGAYFTRRSLLELALMSSDNHAVMALARTYPGGPAALQLAMVRKIHDLGLNSTVLEEPTGLSPNNRASAADIVKIVRAASTYPDIVRFTTQSKNVIALRGRKREYHNTNHLVGAPGWNILLSKTGFTNAAGRCVAMRMQAAGRMVVVVLLGALGKSQRTIDALNVRRWLSGEKNLLPTAASRPTRLTQLTRVTFNRESTKTEQSVEGQKTEAALLKEDLRLKMSSPVFVQ